MFRPLGTSPATRDADIRYIMLVESNMLLRLILDIEGRRLMLLKVI